MNPSDLAALTEQVRAGMEQHQVPGLAIGIWHDGEEWAEGFGVTSQDHPLPVTPQTLFQIGSTTKTVTATLVLRLVEAGKLELDVPVRRYLPELKLQDEDAAGRVTLRHLLTHTGGWAGDLFVRTGDGDDALARYVAAMAGLRQLAPLGGLWSYNNAGFALAGRVVEAVTGQPYERVCREWVLEPLGLSHSFFFPEEVMLHRFAVGHLLRDGQRTIARPWALARNANAVGGLSSTVRDQLRYARFHLGDGRNEQGERVLSPESMRLLQTPQVPAADGQEMGLSFFLRDVSGVRVVSHGGATNGQMSAFWFVPQRNFACTILTNADHGRFLNNGLTAWVQKHLLGLEPPAPQPTPRPAAELAEYAGRYVEGAMGNAIELVPTAEGLEFRFTPGDRSGITETPADPPPPSPALFYDPDRLVITQGQLEGARLEFLRGKDGRIEWLRYSLRVYRRQE